MRAAPATAAARIDEVVRAARIAAGDDSVPPRERAEMLMELAMGLQRRPKTPGHLKAALELYDEALVLCPASETLLAARIAARRATALQAVPEEGTAPLEEARAAFEQVIPTLATLGTPEEVAEAEMNLGLVLQHLAGCARARITDAIAAYQRALRVFDVKRYPVEFAILQSNLATAFLSLPHTDERGKVREALAVQCFEAGLKVVTLAQHPVEYAMLQNNLGNALQYASSGHALENNMRAITAYDEALKVRIRATMPLQYANSLANKANCLWSLGNRREAGACYEEAREVFAAHGEPEKARIIAEAIVELEQELTAAP